MVTLLRHSFCIKVLGNLALRRHPASRLVLSVIFLSIAAQSASKERRFQPEDLFRIRQLGACSWSSDGAHVVFELTDASRTLDSALPTSELVLLNTRSHALHTLAAIKQPYVGFFHPIWSPDGHRLAFLSVDRSANVRLWIWSSRMQDPTPVRDLDVRVTFLDTPMVWINNDQIAVLTWDNGAPKNGDLYFRVLRGSNAAEGWKRARAGQEAAVSVAESGNPHLPTSPDARLLAVDLRAHTRVTLARGAIHHLTASANGRRIAFLREKTPAQPMAAYFSQGATAEQGYMALNWGAEQHLIDARTGAELSGTLAPEQTRQPTSKPDSAVPVPHPRARLIATSPTGEAALYTANLSDGTHLWLCAAIKGNLSGCVPVWHGNEWVGEIATGRTELVSYKTADGRPLTAWLLLPPDFVPSQKLPMVTIVYPGLVYGNEEPSAFSLLRKDFEHPQLFTALGYAVLLPSMPAPENPGDSHALASLPSGVLPAVDAAVARGFVDPDRIAVLGQSNGGFATLGLITQTTRFRSAIASAGFSDLTSLYGTFFGQFRYGDAGPPQKGQAFRVLQMELGDFGLGGPPWRETERYWAESPLLHADRVSTPLFLIHGDLDFIPVQQAEEFYTALFRQDKRALFVRYQGEWHTIASRANVLDLWMRLRNWLRETMEFSHR